LQVLLFAPAFAVVFYKRCGLSFTFALIAWCGIIQLTLGAPFLLYAPINYVSKSFELSRVFFYKWTVNFKFLSEEAFLSPQLSLFLLLLTLAAWTFVVHRYLKVPDKAFDIEHCVRLCFTCNFVGVVFARTLHYQFYSWYFFSIPALCYFAEMPRPLRIFNLPLPVLETAILVAIEYAFNTYPASPTSSLMLQCAHGFLLITLLMRCHLNIGRKPK
jgi:alpha-1,3-mannosyltransferase